jgi:hypothetical protein
MNGWASAKPTKLMTSDRAIMARKLSQRRKTSPNVMRTGRSGQTSSWLTMKLNWTATARASP